MTVENADRRPSPIFTPWIEALLAHERVIVPQVASMRARAFNRAHAIENATLGTPWSRPSWSGWYRVRLGSAVGFGLLTSVAVLHAASSRSAWPKAIDLLLAPPSARISPPSAQTQTPPSPVPLRPELEDGPPEEVAAGDGSSPKDPAILPEASNPALDEVGMLERAQRSDAQGDFLAVLTIVAEHERLYPVGHLDEEREILRLRALIGLKRGNEARLVARRFRHDYPHSVLLPALDEMLAPTL